MDESGIIKNMIYSKGLLERLKYLSLSFPYVKSQVSWGRFLFFFVTHRVHIVTYTRDNPKTISYEQTGRPKARTAALSGSCFKGVGSQSGRKADRIFCCRNDTALPT
jgi:hypothetical protein